MLAISKNVKMNNAKKGFQTDGMSKQEISKINRLAQKSFQKLQEMEFGEILPNHQQN